MKLSTFCKQLSEKYDCYVRATDQRHRVYIDNITVQPEAQRKGTGTKVLRELIRWAYNHRHLVVECCPAPDEGREKDLYRFYERFGFKRKWERNKLSGTMSLNLRAVTNMEDVELNPDNIIDKHTPA